MTKRVLVVLAIGVAVSTPAIGFAWGDVGHRITGEAAANTLPWGIPAFFRTAARQLAYLNPEPDRWRDRGERALDPALEGATSPDHFIDMEMASAAVLAAALRAPNRYAYLDTLARAGVNGVGMGMLPFKMLELSQQLREDFRLWRAASDSTRPWIEARIIDDAGILGHYVADGSNPAHTSIHYNGWTGPNPNGYATDRSFHSRFESSYVGANVRLADVAAKLDTLAHVLPDLRSGIIAYLAATNRETERLYQLDKAHAFDASTTAVENKDFAVARLAAGARMLRDIWWTAWVTSGAPAVTPGH